MSRFSGSTLSAVLVAGAIAATWLPVNAWAYDSHDFTTTASTAGTTAYIVGTRHHDSDFAQAERFSTSQRVALQREAASGGGEHTASLAALLHVDNADQFGRWLQAHYADLYPADARPTNLADRIVALKHA
ncbi:MAG: DUF3015 family protein [Salinisphaera sp.]|nr:DUF3015 family protein [Salinisphaera sp.]